VVVVVEVVAVVAVEVAETTLIALVDLVVIEPTLMNLANNSTDEDRRLVAAPMRVLGSTISSVLKEEPTNNEITLTPEAALAVKAESKLQTFITQSWNRICNVW
jgi:hypothetical protein